MASGVGRGLATHGWLLEQGVGKPEFGIVMVVRLTASHKNSSGTKMLCFVTWQNTPKTREIL